MTELSANQISKSDNTIIQAIGVSKNFLVKTQNTLVLADINLLVKSGEFLVIFGPSGCGKSTLLHILLGLEKPTQGKVFLKGKSLYDNFDEDVLSDLRKDYIGMVYQQPNWVKALTVRENIMFPLRLNGMKAKEAAVKALAVLELVGMLDWQDYIPTELSSGQQQRVALARAMVTNPDLIIADEPTGNLDFKSGQELMKLLANLHKQGKTVIMVTHDLEYLDYASRSLEMFDGRIVSQVNNPSEYFKKNIHNTKRGQKLTQ